MHKTTVGVSKHVTIGSFKKGKGLRHCGSPTDSVFNHLFYFGGKMCRENRRGGHERSKALGFSYGQDSIFYFDF
jgi:hypothetical protein